MNESAAPASFVAGTSSQPLQHRTVDAVLKAAVAGGAGQLREGERMTEEQIRDFCRGQIAHYKVPRYVRFVDSFPLTVTGKVQKYLIRELMRRELGLSEEATA